jgi:hypothetical protein
MNRLKIVVIIFINLFSCNIFCQEIPQKNWRRLVSEAEEFEKLGDILRAAKYYEAAYDLKEDRKDLTYLAGKYYLETRDYIKAVKCLEEVKNQPQDSVIKIPGFKYATALKQLGQYQESKNAFSEFIQNYKGQDKERMQNLSELEILGCDFALKSQEYTNNNIKIKHLSGGINSEKTEFAPIPFDKNVLYFSSTSSGVAKIYRTQRNSDGSWTAPQVPAIFIKMEKTHFGNGTFTPDGNIFYFTQCEITDKGKTRCQIYQMQKEGDKWSLPSKLPEFINQVGSTITHPCVTVSDAKEILYFSSDREGGKGGMDLWCTVRDPKAKDNAFTLPKNLGTNINTWNDEVTPYYNSGNKTLFFSSNGRNSAGGFDIYKAAGEQLKWDFPQNMGFPINSSADDMYYITNDAHGGGYLVSNRTFGNSKFSTTDDDIFFFNELKKQLLLKGTVYSEKDIAKTPLREVNIKIFELIDGSEELIHDKNFAPASEYNFILDAGKDFVMEVNAGGFMTNTANISTKAVNTQETRIKDIAMRVPEELVKTEPKFVIVPAKYNSKENAYLLPVYQPTNPKTGKPYEEGTDIFKAFKDAEAVAQKSDVRMVYWNNGVLVPFIKDIASIKKPGADNKNPTVVKEPEKNKIVNVAYKIQVAAVRKFRDYMYDELQEGELKKYKLVFEEIDGGITRIIVSPKSKNTDGSEGFKDRNEILKILEYLVDHTRFKTSFIVKYENNNRVGGRIKGFTEDGKEVEEP